MVLLGAYSTGALGSVIWRHPHSAWKSHSSVQPCLLANPSTAGADLVKDTTEGENSCLVVMTLGHGDKEDEDEEPDL